MEPLCRRHPLDEKQLVVESQSIESYFSLLCLWRHWEQAECLGQRRIAPDGTPGPYEWITYRQVIAHFAGVYYLFLSPGEDASLQRLPVGCRPVRRAQQLVLA